jgi:hypothetical protein
LITNRSDTPHPLTLIRDGAYITSADIVSAQSISATDELFANDGDIDAWLEDHPTGEFDTGLDSGELPPAEPVDDLAVGDLDTSEPIVVPAWSVTVIEWAAKSPTEAPSIPEIVALTASERTLSLIWNPVPDATRYRVSWGVDDGVYTRSQLIEGTAHTFSNMWPDIELFFVVSALNGEVEGPPSAPISAAAQPRYFADEDFEDGAMSDDWVSGCGDETGWDIADGALARDVTSGAGSCVRIGGEDTPFGDQWISATMTIDAVSDANPDPRFGLVGRCVADDHCVIAYLDPDINKARILIRHPSLPSGWDIIGKSDTLEDIPFLEPFGSTEDGEWSLGALSTTISLDLDGQTIRLWLGAGEDKRLIAAAIDSFVCDEVTGTCEHEKEDVGVSLTTPGPAGVFSRRQPIRFDNFEVQ